MLVVGFMTGFLIPVVFDVFVNGRPVTPHYVADRAEMTGQAVEQITQPPAPPPKITQPPRPDPGLKNREIQNLYSDIASLLKVLTLDITALVRCLDSSAKSSYLPRWWERLDDGSGASQLMIPSCGSGVDAYFAVPSEKVAKILPEGVYGIAIQFLEMNRDEQIPLSPDGCLNAGRHGRPDWNWMNCKGYTPWPWPDPEPPLTYTSTGTLLIIIYLSGGIEEWSMPGMKTCKLFVAGFEQVRRERLSYCIRVGDGYSARPLLLEQIYTSPILGQMRPTPLVLRSYPE
jgi:hypothetical protein